MVLLTPPRQNPWATALARVNLLGPDLLAAQKRLKLTTVQQAKQVGVSTATLAGVLTGLSNPTRATVAACLRWLAQQHQEA